MPAAETVKTWRERIEGARKERKAYEAYWLLCLAIGKRSERLH